MTTIEIIPSTEKWAQDFLLLKSRLNSILSGLSVRIEHVGSTSIPGLAAKPIIDLDIMVATDTILEDVIQRLKSAGFEHRGNLGIIGREAFHAPKDFGATAHIYAGLSEIVAFRNHLAVRDALLASPELRAAYGKMKEDIAREVTGDMAAYCRKKTDFLTGILQRSQLFSKTEILGIEIANRHDILIRPIAEGDEAGAASVHIHSWRERYSGIIDQAHLDDLPAKFFQRTERWRQIIKDSFLEDRRTLVAVRDGNIVGFASVGLARDQEFAAYGELWSLYLLRACQGKQIGYLLLSDALKFLYQRGYRKAYAWVLTENPSKGFYERTGAVDTAIEKTVEIGGKSYQERAMVWNTLDAFL
jgi:GrpB-like predicted nucleotidyltransferase (UPF0157 family)/GNAT superfamily N-acetyltransferase